MSKDKNNNKIINWRHILTMLSIQFHNYNSNYNKIDTQLSKDIHFIFSMLIGILGFTIVSVGLISMIQYFDFTSTFKVITGSVMLAYAKKFIRL
jgi:hypothetical protein